MVLTIWLALVQTSNDDIAIQKLNVGNDRHYYNYRPIFIVWTAKNDNDDIHKHTHTYKNSKSTSFRFFLSFLLRRLPFAVFQLLFMSILYSKLTWIRCEMDKTSKLSSMCSIHSLLYLLIDKLKTEQHDFCLIFALKKCFFFFRSKLLFRCFINVFNILITLIFDCSFHFDATTTTMTL